MTDSMTINMADDLWVWLSEYPDGSVGLIGGIINNTHMPLISRSETGVQALAPIARHHAAETGQRVWLRRYTKAEDYP